MKEKLFKYFKRRKKEVEREQSRRLGETAFILGAVIAAENAEDSVDVVIGGIAGLLIAGIFEVVCPNTANVVKSIL